MGEINLGEINKVLKEEQESNSSSSETDSDSEDKEEDEYSSDATEPEVVELPKEVEELLDNATGLLHLERYESFISNAWPYSLQKGALCHPRALSLAGLGFYSLEPTPSAQCQVCLHVFENLKANSNPWKIHSEAKPDCFLISLGQRDKPDDYTMLEMVQMALKKIITSAEIHLKESEDILKQQLYTLKKQSCGMSSNSSDK